MIENIKIDKSDWTPVAFGDVVKEPKESVKDAKVAGIECVVGLEHIDAENIHLTRFASIDESTTFTKKFAPGDVLFGRRRAYLKKAAQATFEGICSGDITVFRVKDDRLSPELLPFIVQNDKFFDYAIEHSAGGLSPRVKFKDLANYKFLLPPKEQQAELAELLWSMDEVIEKELAVLESLSISREVTFKGLVEDAQGEMTPLSQILVPKKSKSAVPHQRKKYIGLEHIISGNFNCTEYGNTEDVQAQCNIVDTGDLCYSKLRPYLDKAFIASFDAVSTTELLIYDTNDVSKGYLLYHLHSKPFVDYVTGKGFGTKMPRVSHEIIGEYEIKVLKNETDVLNSMQKIILADNQIKEKLKSSKSLQKSLINQIF